MPIFAIAAIALAAVFGLIAAGALAWAITSGQYRDFSAGASSIFNAEEPIGEPTDSFPGEAADPDVAGAEGGRA